MPAVQQAQRQLHLLIMLKHYDPERDDRILERNHDIDKWVIATSEPVNHDTFIHNRDILLESRHGMHVQRLDAGRASSRCGERESRHGVVAIVAIPQLTTV